MEICAFSPQKFSERAIFHQPLYDVENVRTCYIAPTALMVDLTLSMHLETVCPNTEQLTSGKPALIPFSK